MRKISLHTHKFLIGLITTCSMLLLSGCLVGPNYVRPGVEVPAKYKEGTKDWKMARPQNACDKEWWLVFHNPELNYLEDQVNISNQNIAAQLAAYEQSLALVAQARAAYFPTLSAAASVTRQKFSAFSVNGGGSNQGVPGSGSGRGNNFLINTEDSIGLTATWVPDIWGAVRRTVEQSRETAQASHALLAATRLSMQTTLAQDYFQMRALDVDQKILDDTVIADRKALQLTKASFASGTASVSDIASAETTLKTVEAQAIDNHINRALFEHAIAVLIGRAASNFSIKPKVLVLVPPKVPLQVPSALLERRPDIAEAERTVAAANAGIGVAISAYFPTVTLTGTYGFDTFQFNRWFTQPMLFWSIGPQLAEVIYDGGLRRAKVAAARAGYRQTVAQYRQTVLAAFQNVEDNLASLRILNREAPVQRQAVDAALLSLKLQLADYKAGTAAYTSVIVAQTNALAAQKTYSDIAGRQMVAAVGLITALGGGWDDSEIYAPMKIQWPI